MKQLQDDLYQASQDIDSLSKQLQDAIKYEYMHTAEEVLSSVILYRRSDPQQVSPLLYKEISDIKTQCHELETLLHNEEQRRLQVIMYTCNFYSLTHSLSSSSQSKRRKSVMLNWLR